MKILSKLFLRWVGLCTLVAYSSLFCIMWLTAYLKPDYRITVSVNSVGEAQLELIVLPIFLALGIWAVCDEIYKTKLNKKR